MTLAYSLDTDKFQAVSFGGSFLYAQYDRVQSFLNSKFSGKYKNILAKPALVPGSVQWFTNISNPLKRLTEFQEEQQNQIKSEYWELKDALKEDITKLTSSTNSKEKEWGQLLDEVFNEDN